MREIESALRRIATRFGRAVPPLSRTPFAIKDNVDLAHTPTTAGCPDYAYVPARSATVVERLLGAGAVPIGKTNLGPWLAERFAAVGEFVKTHADAVHPVSRTVIEGGEALSAAPGSASSGSLARCGCRVSISPCRASLRDRGLGSQSGCISLAVRRPCFLLGRSPTRHLAGTGFERAWLTTLLRFGACR